MLRALLLIGIVWALPGFAAPAFECRQLYALAARSGLSNKTLAAARTALTEDLHHPLEALSSLKIKAEGIEAVERLGHGVSGTVYLVKYQGRDYALKLFYSDESIKTNVSALVIQKHLGDLGLAPKVVGVLEEKDAQELFRQQSERVEKSWEGGKDPPGFGLLMEYVSGKAFKREDESKLPVTEWQRKRLDHAADQMATALEKLEIQPVDLDIAVTTDGMRLLLIDQGFYQPGPTKSAPMTRQLKSMLGGIVETAP